MVVVAVPVVMAVLMVMAFFHHSVGFEQTHAQQQRQRHISLHRVKDSCILLNVAQLLLDILHSTLIDEIGLVEHEDVAVDHLRSTDFAGNGLRPEVLGINQGDDRVESRQITQLAAQKCHRDGKRISQPRGFHHEIFHRLGSFENAVDGFKQLAVDRAADAPVAQFDHVLVGAYHQLVVDPDLSEFVDQNSCLKPFLIAQDVIQQRGFPCSEKASENRHRHCGSLHAGGHRRFSSLVPL